MFQLSLPLWPEGPGYELALLDHVHQVTALNLDFPVGGYGIILLRRDYKIDQSFRQEGPQVVF